MKNKKCEICNEREGQFNSHYLRSNREESEGDWVCYICEEELCAEAENDCPCGCGGDMEKCVYARNYRLIKTKKVALWFQSEETGVSSMTMAYIATGATVGNFDAPYDPSDFSRCYELLKLVPEIREDFARIGKIVPRFAGILENWDELCALHEQERYNELYRRIQQLRLGISKKEVS